MNRKIMRPQDILVLFKLAAVGDAPISQNELASSLRLSRLRCQILCVAPSRRTFLPQETALKSGAVD
jgi:hypothetical protein